MSVISRKISSNIRKEEDGTFNCGRCSVSAHCYVILLVFSAFFFIVGTLLTAIAFKAQGADESSEHYQARKVRFQLMPSFSFIVYL